jgi:hypothetical protein
VKSGDRILVTGPPFVAAMARVPDVEPEPHDRLPQEVKSKKSSSPAKARRATGSGKRAK